MKERSTEDITSQLDSINGGIPMWISRFADYLAEFGTDDFFKEVEEMSARSGDHRLRDDLHFLSMGVLGIGEAALQDAIRPLRGPWQQMGELSVRYQRCAESLEGAEAQWHIAAEEAKRQLEVWEKWAYETELAQQKKLFPWKLSSWSRLGSGLNLHFEIYGARAVLNSPKKMKNGIAFFKSKIDAIQKIISRAYIANQLPVDCRVSDFDKAIDDLSKCQTQADELSDASDRIMKKWRNVGETYFSRKKTLVELLWLMPRPAHLALFWLCRPDLRESRNAPESPVPL